MSKVLTIEVTSAEEYKTISSIIPVGKLRLKHYRVDMRAPEAGEEERKVLNVEIGNIVSPAYVIDDDPTWNYFKIGLSRDLVYDNPNIAGKKIISTVRDVDIPLTMSGELPKSFFVRVRNNRTFTTHLDYMMLQFEVN